MKKNVLLKKYPYAEWQGNFLWIHFLIQDEKEIWVALIDEDLKEQIKMGKFKGKISGWSVYNREIVDLLF